MYKRFRELKIVSPTPELIDRLIRSAVSTFEDQFFNTTYEKNSTYIYSQLKSCSSSEVAAMIEGLLRHCTEMEVEKNYVDSHGQSEVAFAFCHLLGYQLMPRLSEMCHRLAPGYCRNGSYLKTVHS